MTKAKSKSGKDESPNNEPAEDKSADSTATESGDSPKEGAGSSTATAVAKKPLGAKEIIPFAWKLVGTSQDTVLTLFKTVDRAEAEGQLARLQNAGSAEGPNLITALFEAQDDLIRDGLGEATPADHTRRAADAAGEHD